MRSTRIGQLVKPQPLTAKIFITNSCQQQESSHVRDRCTVRTVDQFSESSFVRQLVKVLESNLCGLKSGVDLVSETWLACIEEQFNLRLAQMGCHAIRLADSLP